MTANATPARHGLPPFYRRRAFWRTALPVIAMAAAFLVGIGLYTAFKGSGHENRIPLQTSPPTPKTVKLSPTEAQTLHGLIRQFVHTAVAHKNLAEAYRLSGPGIREGISLKRWVGGQVTIVPYPVDAKTTIVFEKPDWVHARNVQYQVHVITPDRPNQIANAGSETFFVDLIKDHGRWLVNDWVARWAPKIPNANG